MRSALPATWARARARARRGLPRTTVHAVSRQRLHGPARPCTLARSLASLRPGKGQPCAAIGHRPSASAGCWEHRLPRPACPPSPSRAQTGRGEVPAPAPGSTSERTQNLPYVCTERGGGASPARQGRQRTARRPCLSLFLFLLGPVPSTRAPMAAYRPLT
ncbi:hypothetical protein CALCODRAFT_85800 [Calocera cornea HHB12733]|uniref:Uncharacterized protein n=1 Tax=Calocera cornea HHB12733 TaxID=1353952 RepID=A0A165IP88_9BASI|nr:hypothetical protein CALCODRAFT_85800 [Calocera cornea HHB12733]